MQLISYAEFYGFAASIQNPRDADFPSGEDNVINLDTTEGKKQEKSKTMNVIAVDNLSMTFTSK